MKKIFICALTLLITIATFTNYTPIYAETIYASSVDDSGNTTYYYSIDDAWYAAVDDGKKITLERDWNLDDELFVDTGDTVYVNLNGYYISRNLGSDHDSYEKDGMVFDISSNANVTLTGGTKSRTFNVGFNGSTETVTSGGLISGGNSSNSAGGIHMRSGAKLYLDNVAVAGNRSSISWYSFLADNPGYGAGIYINRNCEIYLTNNAQIAYNYAEADGGGIFVNDTGTIISLSSNSSIHHNSAEDGGGIDFKVSDNKLFSNDSTGSISYNRSRANCDYGGGAILVDGTDSSTTISSITFQGNSTYNDGGAIYMDHKSVTIANCKFIDNVAEHQGGAIYNNDDNNVISGCEITNNKASSAGGGVFAQYGHALSFKEITTVKNNTRGDGSADDVYLDWSSDSNRAYITGGPSSWSEIGIRPAKQEERLLSDTETYYFANAFFSDYENYHIEFDDDNRELWIKSGAATPTAKEEVSPDIVHTGKEYNGKEIIEGYFSMQTMGNQYQDVDTNYYYSDGYFITSSEDPNIGDPNYYDTHLATMSMSMACSTFSRMGKDGAYNSYDGAYVYKSKNIERLLTDIGVSTENIYINDDNTVQPTTSSVGVAIGQKVITDHSDNDYILVPIAIRGQGYEAEWYSNTTIGTTGEAEGFASSADAVFIELQNYISNYNLEDAVSKGKVKFWITGYSRGGAVANLTAKRIIEAYCSGTSTETSNQVYAYCFEAPKGGVNSALQLDKSKYYCIHNSINPVDLVPFVAPEEMGFIRYGVDHYNPGSTDTSVTEDTTVWSYVQNQSWASSYSRLVDNNYYDVGTDAYNAQRTLMKAQLKSVDPDNVYFVDQFTLYYARYIAQAAKQSMYKKVDSNGGNINQRQFISMLWRSIEAWGLFSTDTQGDYRNSYASIASGTTDGVTFQTALQSLTKIIFSKDSTVQKGLMTSISSGASEMMSDYIQLYHIWDDVIGDWAIITQEKRNEYLDYFWENLMTKKAVTTQKAAIDYLTNDEISEMHTAWNTVLDVLLRWVAVDYETKINDWNSPKVAGSTTSIPITEGITSDHSKYSNESQVLLGTLAQNVSAITQAHYPEINLSWVRSYDSFYDDDANRAIKIVTDKVPVITDSFDANDETLTLTTSSDTKGASIYYRTKSNLDTEYSAWKPYNKAISLTPLDSNVTSYDVQMTAVYCTNVSEVVTKTYTLNKAHTVTVNGTSIGTYRVGNTVTINGTSTDSSQVFISWKDAEGITFADQNSAITTFTMPDYDVSLEANYASTISNATLTVDAPVGGSALTSKGTLTWGEDNSLEVEVYWRKGNEQPIGNAEYNTTYRVVTIIPEDTTTSRYFNKAITANNITVVYNNGSTANASEAYVDAKGSLVIQGPDITTSKPKITAVEETSITIVEDQEITIDDLPTTATVTAEDHQTYTVNVDCSSVPEIQTDDLGNKYIELPLVLSDTDAVINTDNIVLKVNITTQTRPAVPTITATPQEDGSKQINISCTTDGAQIFYKINNSEQQEYTGEFTLSGTEGQKETYTITVWSQSDDITSLEHTETFVIDRPYTVTIHSVDTLGTISEWDPDDIIYHYYKNENVTIAPPAQDNELFNKWKDDTKPEGATEDSNHALKFTITGNTELTAVYKPIVNNVSLTIEKPALGKTLADKVTSATVQFVNEYDLTNYLKDITWSPNSGYPVYGSTYTAKISLTEQAAQNQLFVLANNASITVNNDEGIVATFAKSGNTYDIYVTFPTIDKIDLVNVKQPPIASTTRENAAQGIWNLPSSTSIVLANGTNVTANINWDTLPTFDPSNLNAQEYEVTGNVVLPEYVSNSKEISLEVKTTVTVPSAPQVAQVSANYESGNYVDPIKVSLSTDTEGASIYYTLDGTNPTTSSPLYTEEIEITSDTTLKVVAIKEGMISTSIKTYTYTIGVKPTPTPTATSETKKKKDSGWDDGGPFTTDTCGNVYDRWGNKIYEATSCNVGGYNLVGTDTKD